MCCNTWANPVCVKGVRGGEVMVPWYLDTPLWRTHKLKKIEETIMSICANAQSFLMVFIDMHGKSMTNECTLILDITCNR